MAHELTTREDGSVEMAYLEGTPVWHGLGNVFQADASIDAIKVAAGMDWTCNKTPVTYSAGGAVHSVEDRYVQVRSDTHAPLGIVSGKYETVQPGETLEFFRDLTEAVGLQLTTAGTLFGGRRMWTSAFIGEQSVIDDRDRVRSYLLLSTSLDGSMATTARFTSVCVVCNNTLRMAQQGGGASVKVFHSSKFDAADAKKKLGVAPRTLENFMEKMRKLATVEVTEARASELTDRLLGREDGPAHTKIMSIFTGAEELIGGDMAGRRGTAWAWLNSVTQYVDHDRKSKSESHQINTTLFGRGDDVKFEAQRLVGELV